MKAASKSEPMKSIRRSREERSCNCASGFSFLRLGRKTDTMTMASARRGACPANDHRQPIVSARRPPMGPPALRPMVITIFM